MPAVTTVISKHLAPLFLVAFVASTAWSSDLPLADGDRIVFLGDSITSAQKWTNYVTSYLILSHPELMLHIQTEGKGGTAIAESCVNPPSMAPVPSLPTGERYPKRVAPYHPRYVFVMFGHNGGLTADAFKTDYEWLIDKHIVGQSRADAVLVASHPQSTSTGKPILGEYVAKLLEIGSARDLRVSDTWNSLLPIFTNSANWAMLQYPGTQNAPTTHPGTAGHILIAYQTIKNLGLPTLVSSATLNANNASVTEQTQCTITGTALNSYGGIDFRRLDRKLPWAVDDSDPQDGIAQAVAMMPALRGWQDYSLKVTGLADGDYEIFIDDVSVAVVPATALAAGWNMADLGRGPVYDQVQEVLGRIRDMHGISRTTLEATAPNKSVVRYVSNAKVSYETDGNRGEAHEAAMAPALGDIASLDDRIHEAAQPVNRLFSIRRVEQMPGPSPTATPTATPTPTPAPTDAPAPSPIATPNPTVVPFLSPAPTASPSPTAMPVPTVSPSPTTSPLPRAESAYLPPVGIPAPSFGIKERHTDFAGKTFNFGAGAVPYPDAGHGPYTHYVDNTHSEATDTNNTYGTPMRPRKTIPSSLPAGSVVEIHGSGYALIFATSSAARTSSVVGTASAPIYIRGVTSNQAVIRSTSNTYGLPFVMIDNPAAASDPNRPIITTTGVECFGLAYLIIENLEFDMSNAADGMHFNQTSHHCAVRNCIIRGAPATYGRDVVYQQSNSRWQAGDNISDIVWYRNKIGPNGEATPSFESGIQGLGLKNSTVNCWVLENFFYHNAEDNIHIWGGSHGDDYAHHVYIGANAFDGNGENAIDIKQSHDVIVSSNEMRNFFQTYWPYSGASGEAIVFNDDSPSTRKWAINNVIHDCNIGIRSQSIGDNYVIGNIFFNIYHDPNKPIPTSPGHTSGVCVATSNHDSFHIVNNTFDDVDGGVYVNNGGATIIDNNVFGRLKETTTWHQRLNSTTSLSYPSVANNFYLNPRRFNSSKAVDSEYVAGDPGFMNAVARDFRLKANSAARDKGKVSDAYAIFQQLYGVDIRKDLSGAPRRVGNGWEPGAFERPVGPYPPTSLHASPRP